eukprot:9354019-Pyramimonas_sp.AAC.1
MTASPARPDAPCQTPARGFQARPGRFGGAHIPGWPLEVYRVQIRRWAVDSDSEATFAFRQGPAQRR